MYLDIKTPLDDWSNNVRKFQPNIIIGYPSAIKILAELVTGSQMQVKIKRVISCGEPLGAGASAVSLQKPSVARSSIFTAPASLSLLEWKLE